MPNEELWGNAAWDALSYAVESKRCAPFLGSGASADVLPTGKKLSRILAEEYEYPFADSDNLSRVAQFAAVEGSEEGVKGRICKLLKNYGQPSFADVNEPHRVMAELGLPVYITTNYDDFMMKAIEHVGRELDLKAGRTPGQTPSRAPQKKICKWYEARQRQQGGKRASPDADDEWLNPTSSEPVVYHLHGTWDETMSIVLTEDDYLDFLIYANDLIPSRIEQAFTDSSLLFLGYSLEDMNFKVLFRRLATRLRLNRGTLHAAVQLGFQGEAPTPEEKERAERQRRYLERQFYDSRIRIYWGTCTSFVAELRQHL